MAPREKETLAADLRWRLARDCQAANLGTGDLLPSISTLTVRYGATLALARDFYRRLEAEGLVEAVHGKGVFLRRSLDGGGRPRSLNAGLVTYLDFAHPDHRTNLASTLINSFERKSVTLGGSSRLFNLYPGFDVTSGTLAAIKAARPDGLVFLPKEEGNPEDNIRQLLTLDIPLVVASHTTVLTHCVAFDHRQAAMAVTRHLRTRGLERLAFLQQRSVGSWAQERLEGFASSGGGLTFVLEHLPYVPESQVEVDALLPKLLAERVQGVVCSGDGYAVRLLTSARRQGLRVPEDMAIAGMNDDVQHRPHDLTTVQTSLFELGNAAYDLLAEVVAVPHTECIERRLPCPLLVRNTTRPVVAKIAMGEASCRESECASCSC